MNLLSFGDEEEILELESTIYKDGEVKFSEISKII